MEPTQAGFLLFIRNVMGITTAQLPDNSPWITTAYNVAIDIVNDTIAQVSDTIYAYAVYNLAGSNLLNYAPDQPNQPPIQGSNPPVGFFANARKVFNLQGFVSGVIQSSNDESTGQSMVVQEAAKNFTLANLQQLKDPYGRQYLAFAQTYGPAAWVMV